MLELSLLLVEVDISEQQAGAMLDLSLLLGELGIILEQLLVVMLNESLHKEETFEQ